MNQYDPTDLHLIYQKTACSYGSAQAIGVLIRPGCHKILLKATDQSQPESGQLLERLYLSHMTLYQIPTQMDLKACVRKPIKA